MKLIVIATDGSAPTHEAVRFGVELAAEHDAKAIFVHVAPAMDVVPGGGFGFAPAVPHKLTAADAESLEDALSVAAEGDVDADTMLLRGDPADEIVAYADSVDADLIVVGSRGHGRIANTLLGSVSRGVLRESRRPVLVVRAAPVPAEALTV